MGRLEWVIPLRLVQYDFLSTCVAKKAVCGQEQFDSSVHFLRCVELHTLLIFHLVQNLISF